MRPVDARQRLVLFIKTFHPLTRALVFLSFAICLVTIIPATLLARATGAVTTIQVIIGDTAPSTIGHLDLSVPLAILGYALLPAFIGLIVAAAVEQHVRSRLIDTKEALERVAKLLKQ
jgi:hypothetical protein